MMMKPAVRTVHSPPEPLRLEPGPDGYLRRTRARSDSASDLGLAHLRGFGREPLGDAVGPFKERAYYHAGAGSNLVYVDQENDLVVVLRWIRQNQFNRVIEVILSSLEP